MRPEGYRKSIKCVPNYDVAEYPNNGFSIGECECAPSKKLSALVINEQRGTSRFATTCHHPLEYSYSYSYTISIAPRRIAPQPRQELIALAATGEEFDLCCDKIFELHLRLTGGSGSEPEKQR